MLLTKVENSRPIETRRHDFTCLSIILLEKLNQECVSFAHFKSNSHLDKGLAGETDLDILVDKKDNITFQIVITDLGFRRFTSPKWSCYPSIEDWIGFDSETGRLLHLHVHYAILTGLKTVKHLHIPWEKMVFQHICIDPKTEWPIPKPEVELAIFLVRIWAKQPFLRRLLYFTTTLYPVPSDIHTELMDLLQQSDIKELLHLLKEEAAIYTVSEWHHLLEQCKEKDELSSIVPISISLNKQLRNHWRMPFLSVCMTSLCNRLSLLSTHIYNGLGLPIHNKKVVQPTGVMFAFIGLDGSGKTTVSKEITAWLNSKIDVHQFYLGSGESLPIYLRLPLLVYQTFFGILSKVTSFRNDSTQSFYNKMAMLSHLFLVRRKLKTIQKARQLCLEGSVVITDRFPQLQQYDINDGPKLQNGRCFTWAARKEIEWLNQCLALGPDIIFRLNVSSDIAHKRKPYESIEVIKKKTQIIGKLEYSQISKLYEIDSNNPKNQVINDIKKLIFKNI